jgi:hypothetical protein
MATSFALKGGGVVASLICKICNILKCPHDFYTYKKGYTRKTCKSCAVLWNKKWKRDNAELVKKAKKKYTMKNRAAITKYHNEWVKKNRDVINAQNRKYYKKRMKIIQQNKEL